MDLETENRIAAVLLKEAVELRRQAETDGALAYLHRPNVRGRPNSRFLTATVLGVQQANRVVEVNEMWKLRQKEQELENRLKGRSADKNSDLKCHSFSDSERRSCERCDTDSGTSGLKKRERQDSHSSEDEGLRDAEIEEFLHSRVKRGRGTVGSRMDEAGPYLPSCPDPRERESESPDTKLSEGRKHMVVGPEKPVWLNSPGSSENESLSDDKIKVPKKAKSSRYRHHCKKHRSKKKSKDKEDKKRREQRRIKCRK